MKSLRSTPFGIPSVGELPWGSHLCHFYRDRQELVESLVPYFRAGLEKGERCLWVTADPLRAVDATGELARVMPGLAELLERRIRILDAERWYAGPGRPGRESLVEAWLQEEREAALGGCTGLRVAGNLSFVKRDAMAAFLDYERAVDRIFPAHQIVALCSYDLGICDASDVRGIVGAHRFTLERKEGEWELVESERGRDRR